MYDFATATFWISLYMRNICFLFYQCRLGRVCTFHLDGRAGIFEESMGARNRGGIGLTYRPARLHRLAEFIP
jgi:hypothetical protein